jgi:integrase
VTLDEYLDEWFALQRTRLEPSTWHNYRTMAAIYLRPALGPTPLAELTSRQLDLHYVRLLEDGGRGGRPLARRTVAYAHAILRKALGDAVADGLLDASPAERAEVPRVDPRFDDTPRRLRTWDADQVAHFLRHPRDRELHDLWRVALGTGMRRGELLGLRWEDLDLDVPQLRVAAALTSAGGQLRLKGTKTRKVRTLHLDDDTAAVLARQPRRPPVPYPLVFTRPDGGPWRPEVVTDRWRAQWPGLELPFVRLRPRPQAHARHLAVAGGGADQGGERAPRAQPGGDDPGCVRPRAPGDGPGRRRRHRRARPHRGVMSAALRVMRVRMIWCGCA